MAVDDRPSSGDVEGSEPVRETHLRTTVVTVDVAQLVVSLTVLGIYAAALILRGNVPAELNSALFVVVGAVVAKRLPS